MVTTQQLVGHLKVCLIAIAIVFFLAENLSAQQSTVGLLEYSQDGQQGGYVLFAPTFSTKTYLINKCGEQVHSWDSKYKPGFTVSLLNDGSILRSGVVENQVFNAPGGGGIIEKITWDNDIEWTYTISDSTMLQHHAIAPMPNGNVLALVWEFKTMDEAIDQGRNPDKVGNSIWSEKIIEIKPTGSNSGTIVWEWKLWDHLIQNFDNETDNFGAISDNPHRIDVNYVNSTNPDEPDWIHANAIDYNADLDQILISAHSFNEIWVIDHSTTTQEAAAQFGGNSGKGGDIIYRWGNPAAYERGTPSDKKLFGQHNPHWISRGLPDEGAIMIFNNGMRRIGNYSSIDIITPPIDIHGNYQLEDNKSYSPAQPKWTYTDSIRSNFFAFNQSGAQRLPNGNTLVCASPSGTFFEIDKDKKTIWKYVSPVSIAGITKQGEKPYGNTAFRAELYTENFPAFNGKDLTDGMPIELEPGISLCSTSSIENSDTQKNDVEVYPNPTGHLLFVKIGIKNPITKLSIINTLGEEINKEFVRLSVDLYSIDVHDIPMGMYTLNIYGTQLADSRRVMIMR